ncbi:MAG: hypothetical protein JWN60_2195 [Acidobacteria bacterium]|jgi:hypothetical protein|nr:hypothetical protein [Acidobacteriota bacterium]
MFSLQDLLGQEKGSEAVEQISRNVGADHSSVNSAIQLALPVLINGLAKNASTPEGAQSLDRALEQDHNGSILNNLGGLGDMIFGGSGAPSQQVPKQANAGGILGHIFGNNQGQVAQQISKNSSLDIGQISQILMFLAPIVMGYLGRRKQEEHLDPGGLSGYLGEQQQQIQNSPQGGLLGNLFDRDGDGSSMDDIASMAMNYINRR